MSVIVLSPVSGPETTALQTALRVAFGRIRPAASTEAALAAHAEESRAPVVVDLRGGGLEADQAAADLRRSLPTARILVLADPGQPTPTNVDGVLTSPVYLAHVVGWCRHHASATLDDGALADLATGMSHEIGNPLTSLLLQLQMLKEDGATGELLSQLELIEDSGRRIQNVIQDVRGASERQPVAARTMGVAEVIADARRRLADQHPELERRLEVSCGEHQVCVQGELIATALADLWRYLLLATPDDQVLVVETGTADDATLTIRATAQTSRLPTDAASRLFTPLWARQALGLTDDLSLTSARSVFLRHQGDLRAREEPGGALRVDALLPRAANGKA
jgi:signal transduction histidine kinase